MCKGFCLFLPDPGPLSPIATLAKGASTRRGERNKWILKVNLKGVPILLISKSFKMQFSMNINMDISRNRMQNFVCS